MDDFVLRREGAVFVMMLTRPIEVSGECIVSGADTSIVLHQNGTNLETLRRGTFCPDLGGLHMGEDVLLFHSFSFVSDLIAAMSAFDR
jgi:hypothetical protein